LVAMHSTAGYAWDKWEPGMESLKRVSPAAGKYCEVFDFLSR
jgi:hypothetical protein